MIYMTQKEMEYASFDFPMYNVNGYIYFIIAITTN